MKYEFSLESDFVEILRMTREGFSKEMTYGSHSLLLNGKEESIAKTKRKKFAGRGVSHLKSPDEEVIFEEEWDLFKVCAEDSAMTRYVSSSSQPS